jgi:hypothetical protein
MNQPRYFSTHNESSTPEGVHRRFTLEWSPEENDAFTLMLHTIWEPRMIETRTTLHIQRLAVEQLFELLGYVLQHQGMIEQHAPREEA